MIRNLVLATTVVALVVVAAPAPAAAAAPKADLVVSVVAEAGWARAVTLRCGPSGGGHPKAAKACAALWKAGGKPSRLKPGNNLCTLEYAPLTAAINGRWEGRTVRWSRDFGNPCELARATGVVFDF